VDPNHRQVRNLTEFGAFVGWRRRSTGSSTSRHVVEQRINVVEVLKKATWSAMVLHRRRESTTVMSLKQPATDIWDDFFAPRG
jgi:hypothetical protein